MAHIHKTARVLKKLAVLSNNVEVMVMMVDGEWWMVDDGWWAVGGGGGW